MLSIGKLGRGQEGYYLQAVARGVEGYYLGSGEAPGRWIGSGCGGLGLTGRVAAEELRAVDGRSPADPQRSLIWQRRSDRLPDYDLSKRFLPMRLRSTYRDEPLTQELEACFGAGTTLGDPRFRSCCWWSCATPSRTHHGR